jgi:flagellar P-ring protein precursor FlgI
MQSIANMLNRLGLKFAPDDIRVKNTAAVLVTAELPPFIRPGSRIDILASSLGDATSLQGGTLVSTPLKGPDGRVYAVAQGHIALAGFTAGGNSSKVRKNHQTAGKVPGGAIIEQEVPVDIFGIDGFNLSLRSPDFTTAKRVAAIINDSLGPAASPESSDGEAPELARAMDPGSVRVAVPEEYRDGVVEFISRIEALNINPDMVTKVVVNERTGTVVMGENVKISKVAISHGDITIEIKTQYLISQPQPFSQKGDTVVQPVETTRVRETKSRLIVMPESTTLGEVVRALNLVGVTPRDLVAILQAIKAAGALHAELEII